MNPALDSVIREAYALAPATVSYIHTLELSHESLPQPLRLVQGYLHRTLGTEAGMVVFRACPFTFTLPAVNDGGLTELNLAIDNVDRAASDFCEAAMALPTPVVIKYRPYMSTDLTQSRMDPPLTLYLLNVQISATQVQGRAVPVDFLNLRFPSEEYTRAIFPHLGN